MPKAPDLHTWSWTTTPPAAPLRSTSGRCASLLNMAGGRSKQVFKTWLAGRTQVWRDRIEVVAMDGFTGFKIAAAEELPGAVAVMDAFHAVRSAGDALDLCRRRVQQARRGHRASKGDPLYDARRDPAHRTACSPTSRLLDCAERLDTEPAVGERHLPSHAHSVRIG